VDAIGRHTTNNWTDRKTIKPELLVSCGTSGAVQYTAAIQGAGIVVAINRDPHAPIFKIADFGVVADALSFLPAFIREAKGHLLREITDLYRTQVKTGRDQKSVSFGQRIKKLRRTTEWVWLICGKDRTTTRVH